MGMIPMVKLPATGKVIRKVPAAADVNERQRCFEETADRAMRAWKQLERRLDSMAADGAKASGAPVDVVALMRENDQLRAENRILRNRLKVQAIRREHSL